MSPVVSLSIYSTCKREREGITLVVEVVVDGGNLLKLLKQFTQNTVGWDVEVLVNLLISRIHVKWNRSFLDSICV